MYTFIHAADIHLDSPLRGLDRYEGAPIREIRGASRQALENLVGLALEEQVAFVLIAGDLYDGDWKDYNTGLFFNGQMRRLREAGIRVVIVSGNHDAASRITRTLDPPSNVSLMPSSRPEKLIIEDLGVAIVGRSYPQRAVTEDLSLDYPTADPGLLTIGMLHTSVDGREGHEPYAPCNLAGLADKGYAYWALGHVHQREILRQDPWIVFSGCIQGRHARELGPKGCTLVTVDDDRIASVQHHDLDVVRWALCQIDVSEARNGDDVVGLVRSAITAQIEEAGNALLAARIVLTGASRAHRDLTVEPTRWQNEIRNAAIDLGDVWIEKIKLTTQIRGNLAKLRRRKDAVGSLLRALDDLEGEGQDFDALIAELEPLRRALPSELTEGPEGLDLTSVEALRSAMTDVKQVIVARLLAAEGE
jgi:DNA repair exonuclease SbcCD nuclease subunit